MRQRSFKNILVFICVVLLLAYFFFFDSKTDSEVKSTREEDLTLLALKNKLNSIKIINVGLDSENLKQSNVKKKIVKTSQVCKLPKLEENNAEIMKFSAKLPPLRCAATCQNNWVDLDDTNLLQITEYTKKYLTDLNCFWTFFERVDDKNLKYFPTERVVFNSTIKQSDFFEVKCTAKEKGLSSKRKWKGLFMIPVKNIKRFEELKNIKQPDNWSGLNVYVLGFDSVSHMEFRRNAPKTMKYLEEVMDSNTFNGFNIVGDGTPQAFIPFLTGSTEIELPLTRKRYSTANYVDDVYPFAWKNFSRAGYATLYGEDAYNIGTFTYRLKGFRHQPTDHFTPTFFHETERFCKGNSIGNKMSNLFNYFESVDRKCCQYCLGDKPQIQSWLKYAETFFKTYNEVPRFLLMHHSLLSHDSINDFQMADEDLYNHLKKQFESGSFENTMVVIMADHGRRFSELRNTQQGQLEERLPFFSVYMPKELESNPKYATAIQNLKINAAERLVSHFDVYSTLMDLLNWPSQQEFERPADLKQRSISLFRNISAERTCEEAGIEAHWCTCLQWKDAMSNSIHFTTAKTLALSVVKVMNQQTEPERKLCAPLSLVHLIDAKLLVSDDKVLQYNGVTDVDGFVPIFNKKSFSTLATFLLVFEVTPGKGKYEATVFYNGDENSVTIDLNSISHVNAYGDLPHCIINKNYFLAAYCVCYDKI